MKFVHAFAFIVCIFLHCVLFAVASSDSDDSDSSEVATTTTTTTTTTSTSTSTTTTTASALVADDVDDTDDSDDSDDSDSVDIDTADDDVDTDTTTTTTATPTTTEAITTTAADDVAAGLVVNATELCGCYDVDLVCAPITLGDQVCYYYTLTSTGNDTFCNGVESIFLSIDNDGECNASLTDVTASLTDAAPSCLDIGISTSPFDAIQITLDETLASGLVAVTTTSVAADADTQYDEYDSVDSVDSYDSYDSYDSVAIDSDTASDADSDSDAAALPGAGTIYVPGNIRIFTLCFDADAVSGGVQENGQIGFDNDDLPFVCPYPNILPDFCGESDDSDPVSGNGTAPTEIAPPMMIADGESANGTLQSGVAGRVSTLGLVFIVLGVVVLALIAGFAAWSKLKRGSVYHKTSVSIDIGNPQQEDEDVDMDMDGDGEAAGIVTSL